jgi:protein RecA
VIFINQIREKIGVMFGSPETTPGGRALKFYSSCRVDVRRISSLKEGETQIGIRMRAKIVKNKVAPPFRIAEFDMYNASGISYEADLVDLAVSRTRSSIAAAAGLVTGARSWVRAVTGRAFSWKRTPPSLRKSGRKFWT